MLDNIRNPQVSESRKKQNSEKAAKLLGLTPHSVATQGTIKRPQYQKQEILGDNVPPLSSRQVSWSQWVKSFFISEPVEVSLKAGAAGSFKLDTSCFPIVKNKQISEEDVYNQVAMKIEHGHNLLQAIAKGTLESNAKCSMEDMTDIMWYLYAQAEQKAGSFSSGAITIEDPEGKILQFLDTNKEVYQRISSHIKDFQKREKGVHCGIDNNNDSVTSVDDFATILPHKAHSLLYGPMLMKKPGVDDVSKQMLWLKMESHGSWLFGPKGFVRFGDRNDGPKSRPLNSYDIHNAVGHSLSYVHSLFRAKLHAVLGHKPAKERKERIPKEIKKAYKKLIKEMHKLNLKGVESLNKSGLKTSEGIRVMRQNVKTLNDCLNQLLTKNVNLDKSMKTSLAQAICLLDTFEKEHLTFQPDMDHLDWRIGKEVIIMKEEYLRVEKRIEMIL